MDNRKEIIKANLNDIGIITDILGEAFYNDPIIYHLARRAGFARDLFELEFRDIYASLNCSFLIIDENKEKMGCALWAKPGQTPNLSPLGTIRLVWAILNRVGTSSLKRFNDISELIDKYHPQEPHYYLHAIGVKNAFRGKGAGSGLLTHVLDIADNEQMPAYLENSNELNLSLYQKYGFKVIGKENLSNEGPPIWFMYRSPKILN